jgi:hypothetical protein
LGWAAVLIVAAGTVVAGWDLRQRQPTLELAVRFERPAAPEIAAAIPPIEVPKPAALAPRVVPRQETLETQPTVWVAAIIPPDPETGATGGMLLELESKDPNVVLYFLADNQGD